MSKQKIETRILILNALILENEARGDPMKMLNEQREEIEVCKFALYGLKVAETIETLNQIKSLIMQGDIKQVGELIDLKIAELEVKP